LISRIDRSERIDIEYTVADGRLQGRIVDYEVPTWSRDGSGEHSVAGVIDYWYPVVERGAAFFGAFATDEVAGLAIVDPSFEPNWAWLAFMYSSRPYRRQGVASTMWHVATRLARNRSADGMYISAVPSGSAIGFYLAMGAELATEPHPGLSAAEPDDIQLVYRFR